MALLESFSKEIAMLLVQFLPAVDDFHVFIVVEVETFNLLLEVRQLHRSHAAPSEVSKAWVWLLSTYQCFH